ncbi:MAG: hypothetical protein KatS3mg127_0416 [Silanimonas sp.]|nr:MAG: hypothetical protein KatS3mg127_0416 [Silanimonas sp.]
MRRLALVLALSAFAGGAFAAPETVRVGQTVRGELTVNDAPRDDGGVSKDYKVEAKSGQFLIVSVISDDFDGHVTIYNPDRSKAAENDDRADGNLNPLAVVETSQDGVYTVRVGSLGGGDRATGRFTMKVVAFSE